MVCPRVHKHCNGCRDAGSMDLELDTLKDVQRALEDSVKFSSKCVLHSLSHARVGG